jgi:hypothetical protein
MSSSSSTDESSTATTTTAGSVINNATASSKHAPDADFAVSTPEQASSVWREFQEISEKLLRHSHAYSDIGGFMERQSAMELQLQEQKDHIHYLELQQQYQIKNFEARYDDWKKEKTSLELEKKSVEDKMAEKHRREMQQVDKDLMHETERAKTLVKKLDRANAEASLVKKDLAVCKDKLQEWELYTTQLKDVDFESLLVYCCPVCIISSILTILSLRERKLTKLFQDCYRLVDAHFSLDLPAELLAVRSKRSAPHSTLKTLTTVNRTTLNGRSKLPTSICHSDFLPPTR